MQSDVELARPFRYKGRWLPADLALMLKPVPAILAREYLPAGGDQIEPVGPGQQSNGLAHPLPALAPIPGLEQSFLETAGACYDDAARLPRVDGEIDDRTRLSSSCQLRPRSPLTSGRSCDAS